MSLGSNTAREQFPRLLQLVEYYPETTDQFIKKVLLNTTVTFLQLHVLHKYMYLQVETEFLISFEAQAKLAQKWSLCAPLGILSQLTKS